ncbi:hypothetical protein ES707_09193 [subsurface metagenome]
MSDTLYEYYLTVEDFAPTYEGVLYIYGQTFTPQISHNITSVKLKLYRVGSPGTIQLWIYPTTGGVPSGNWIVGKNDYNGNTITTSTLGEWIEFVFPTSEQLDAETEYALFLWAESATESNNIYIGHDATSPTYTRGHTVWSDNEGASWNIQASVDLGFYEYGNPLIAEPTVTTQAVDNIGTTTATGHGTITDTGGENCSKRGVCWNTGGNPTISDSKSEETDSFGTGAFPRSMTGLTPGQHYYVKAYAYNSEGYGYGGQVEFTTNKDCTDSDSGSVAEAKASGNPLATLVRAETGGGVDSPVAIAPLSEGDAGGGVDAFSALLGILSRSDTGLGTDARLALVAALIKADVGSGIEHILDRDLVIEEVGTGLDVILSILGKTASDSGICSLENTYIHIYEGIIKSVDDGEGLDASTLTTLLQRAETGIGADVPASRVLYTRDIGGFFDLSRVLTAIIAGAETGIGAEASLQALYKKKSDSGIGADGATLEALLTGDDIAVGIEALTLMAAKLASDSGVGVEAVLTYLRQLIDSGQGDEIVQLIGAVGRRMRMVVYQQEAFQMKVYTSETGK